jgi:hypothetical protein
MMFHQSTLRLIARVAFAATTIVALVACGDPKSQAPAIVIAFSPSFPPPTALATDATTGIAALVTNDPANAGVNWSCVPVMQCGTFAPNPIASNVPTTYQAPATVPTGNAVTVTAISVTDPTKSVSAAITIN